MLQKQQKKRLLELTDSFDSVFDPFNSFDCALSAILRFERMWYQKKMSWQKSLQNEQGDIRFIVIFKSNFHMGNFLQKKQRDIR